MSFAALFSMGAQGGLQTFVGTVHLIEAGQGI